MYEVLNVVLNRLYWRASKRTTSRKQEASSALELIIKSVQGQFYMSQLYFEGGVGSSVKSVCCGE